MSNNYHLRFYPKIGNGVFTIRLISCDCVACTSMLDKTWISGIPSYEQESYKPVTNCTYWPFLGSFNNWDIIQLSQKSTPSYAFYEIHQVVIDGISDNMASLVESGNMDSFKKLTQQPMLFMLSCSHYNHIDYRITQQLMEKL